MELAPFAQGVAVTGRFDLDDFGAKLRQEAGRVGTGD